MTGTQSASATSSKQSSGPPGSFEERLKNLEGGAASKQKDIWDKLGALSGIVSGILVALIGFYATYIYDQRSRDAEESQRNRSTIATELQTVEKFLPHLASDNEKEKEAAILAVSSLGNTELAAKLATLFGGAGANAALTSIAASSVSGSKDRLVAQTALTDLYKVFRPSIVRIELRDKDGALVDTGTGFIVSKDGYVITAAHVVTNTNMPQPLSIIVNNDTIVQTATMIKSDDQIGLALIKISVAKEQQPLPIANGSAPLVGERVSVFGVHPDKAFVLLSVAGEVASVGGEGGRMLLNAPVVPGMSGSPVFGSKGEVVGIILGREFNQGFEGLSVAIPIQFAKPLLQLAGLT